SQRTFNLSDGTLVQRDWYSAFLLYCYDSSTNSIDKVKCKKELVQLETWWDPKKCTYIDPQV
ncbi:hypothetical protein MXE38_08440, partial [Anaerobiospirillum sp. NML120448]|uniref:hypothetical protein n=1 Tax=Anaerobiospirillum sp. NML120448 TaxID=2932816 RepID=UPI001FF5120C